MYIYVDNIFKSNFQLLDMDQNTEKQPPSSQKNTSTARGANSMDLVFDFSVLNE